MKLNIRGEKIELTDALKEQMESKFAKLNKYFEHPKELTTYINIKINNLSQTIEVTIPTTKFTIRSEATNEDLYTSIDIVIDKIERQIRKNKAKMKKKYKDIPNFDIILNEIDDSDTEEKRIIKRKNIEMKPMDEEEAIIQIELLDHDFFVFKNLNEGCISVLYKRKDGLYGIINEKN